MTSLENLPTQYAPQEPERKWYDHWRKRGYFDADPDPARRPYTIVIPPPNVTGALHLGHALNNTLQDALIRFKRMQGFNALWIPGTDHAGIATQAVVERRLLKEEKKTRHDLGREALVARIWEWKRDYERRILGQLARLGCSLDWRRTRFTLDETCARAVRRTFFDWFRKGYVYRGKRLVNWDTFLQTAVSDDEVYHEPVVGHFWHFRYPVIDPRPSDPETVTIATTRPETMLGDTAVAVHPDPRGAFEAGEKELRAKLAAATDKTRADLEAELENWIERRRSHLEPLEKLRDLALAGRKLRLPLVNREIPLVADEWARPELGSGCVKITPAHDPNDYEVGKRKSLPMINIMTPDGRLNGSAGPFEGLTMAQGRTKVVAEMEALGLLEGVEEREIDLAHSDRSKTPIEPYLADQWFVAMSELAGSAMAAVEEGRVKITPDRYARGYLDWLSEKRDWPIGRQLWWGHRVPIWYFRGDESELKAAFEGRDDISWRRDAEHDQWLVCARDADLAANAVPGHAIVQDEDVLDTWFSSALWPHSTLGWPEKNADLDYFYPTTTLVTNRDIITLWVARMVLAGQFNLGQVPFREVYIHPKILDKFGEGMSKSKGNGVDPIEVMDRFGADALRFALAYLTTETQDIRMPVEFICPRCEKAIEQTKQNRVLPRLTCVHCGEAFKTQWAEKAEDLELLPATVSNERFELARNFLNKIWNASRFALLSLSGYTPGPIGGGESPIEDRWILSRLATVTDLVTRSLDEYRFADATGALYQFAWDDFCGFFLEMIKGRLQDAATRDDAQRTLAHVLDRLLRLLHPLIPFITEEIWHLLAQVAPERGLPSPTPAAESVMVAHWPPLEPERKDARIEARFDRFREVLRSLREVRSRQNIPPKTPIHFVVQCDQETVGLLRPLEPYFASLAGAHAAAWGADAAPPATNTRVALGGMEVFVDLAGLIDFDAEIAKNAKEIAKVRDWITAKEKKLANESFVSKAPAHVIESERKSLAETQEKLRSLEAASSELRKRA